MIREGVLVFRDLFLGLFGDFGWEIGYRIERGKEALFILKDIMNIRQRNDPRIDNHGADLR
jgi:hypothetical protein